MVTPADILAASLEASFAADVAEEFLRSPGGRLELVGLLGSCRLRAASRLGSMELAVGGTRLMGVTSGSAHLFDAADGRELASTPLPHETIQGMAAFPDGARFAFAIAGRVRVRDLSGVEHGSWEGGTVEAWGEEGSVEGMSVLPDGEHLLALEADQVIDQAESEPLFPAFERHDFLALRRVPGGELVWRRRLHGVEDACLALGADGTRAVLGTRAGRAHCWSLAQGSEEARLEADGRSALTAVAVSPRSDLALLATRSGKLRLCRLPGGEVRWTRELPEGVHATGATFSPDARQLLVGGFDGSLHLLDADRGDTRRAWRPHIGSVQHLRLTPDGARAFTGGADQVLRHWRLPSGEEVEGPAGHRGNVEDLAFLPGGEELATASYDGSVRLWEISSGRCLATFTGHEGPVRRVAALAGGQQLLSAGKDGTLRFLDRRLRAEVRRLGDRPPGSPPLGRTPDGGYNLADEPLQALAVSPDGERFVVGGEGRELVLREAGTGRSLARTRRPAGEVTALAFSPDGEQLLVGTEAGTVRLCDGRELRTVYEKSSFRGSVQAIAWRPDGKAAVLGDRRGGLHELSVASGRMSHWPARHEYLASVACTPEGRHVVRLGRAGDRSTLELWRAGRSRELVDSLPVLAGGSSLAAHGGRVAVGGESGAVALYRVAPPARRGRSRKGERA